VAGWDFSTSLNKREGVIQIDIEDVKTKYEDQLMGLPNVTGVGIGLKAGQEVIVVFVTHKVPLRALQPHEVVPKVLEGYGTDVEEIGAVTAQTWPDV
jgi:hypothetical protein